MKELDDEDYSYQAMQEPLYRVETGNYEYRYRFASNINSTKSIILNVNLTRLVLRCRAEARKKFAARRSDVLVKMELLDNKHVQVAMIKDQIKALSDDWETTHLRTLCTS